MASKQPFKFIDITKRLTTWSIRINKFFKHRLLSKRKNVLLLGEGNFNALGDVNKYFAVQQGEQKLSIKALYKDIKEKQLQAQNQVFFEKSLMRNLHKTWQITNIKAITQISQIQKPQSPQQTKNQTNQLNQKTESNIVQSKSSPQEQQQPSTFILKSFNDKTSVSILQQYFASKKKYFDAIIVLPQAEKGKQEYPEIQDQSFATSYINTFQDKIMKNIVSYRYANKFLNTSGAFIQSASEYDFIKKSESEKQTKEKQKSDENKDQFISYVQNRPPSSKQLLDNAICYLGVVVGDRDYTDLNSWTLVSLSQQASKKNPLYVAQMYYNWADGQQLPMPGSFTLFKKKIFTNNKQLNYVQYL